MLTLLQDIKNEQLVSVLSEKFEDISKVLKSVTKIASKGHRKGLLIFTPEAPSTINALKDKFVKYVTRYIFDEYKDYTGGVLWRMHLNFLFNDDICKEIFARVNPTIDELQKQLVELSIYRYNEVQIVETYNTREAKYNYYRRNIHKNNVFTITNPLSKPFYDAREIMFKRVKEEHPRVPDVLKYVEKDYNLSKEYDKLKEEFLKTFNEYNELNTKIDNHYKLCSDKEKEIRGKIQQEMDSEGLTQVKKDIVKLVDQYCKIVASKIISGKIE